MNAAELEKEFREKVCREVGVEPEGLGRFIVYTPFMFDDGDHFVIIAKQEGERWRLTDEGHTFMHMSYGEVNISQGTRKSIIDQTMLNFHVENMGGELVLNVPDRAFGDALFSFVQALVKISDTTYWTRERVKSTFFEDFENLIKEDVPASRRQFNYTDTSHDPEGRYPVDCRVNGMRRPLFIFAINNDSKCRDATIYLHQFEKWGLDFRSMGIFEEQTEINRLVLARFSDVADKQFASLGARDRINKYLAEVLRED